MAGELWQTGLHIETETEEVAKESLLVLFFDTHRSNCTKIALNPSEIQRPFRASLIHSDDAPIHWVYVESARRHEPT
jgi:hypothetical protein